MKVLFLMVILFSVLISCEKVDDALAGLEATNNSNLIKAQEEGRKAGYAVCEKRHSM